MSLKKIIFPLREKNAQLNKYWWHRLLVVIFFIALFFVWIETISSVNYENNEPYMLCLQEANQELINNYQSSNAPNFDLSKADNQCEQSTPLVGGWEGILYGTVVAIGFYYLVQLIYFSVIYPIFRYIIAGKRGD